MGGARYERDPAGLGTTLAAAPRFLSLAIRRVSQIFGSSSALAHTEIKSRPVTDSLSHAAGWVGEPRIHGLAINQSPPSRVTKAAGRRLTTNTASGPKPNTRAT